jgi:uncharacterized membrane protein
LGAVFFDAVFDAPFFAAFLTAFFFVAFLAAFLTIFLAVFLVAFLRAAVLRGFFMGRLLSSTQRRDQADGSGLRELALERLARRRLSDEPLERAARAIELLKLNPNFDTFWINLFGGSKKNSEENSEK